MNKIIYLDAAASALKPEPVIRAEMDFLQNSYANAGRGICARAAAVDDMIARARGCGAFYKCTAGPDCVYVWDNGWHEQNRAYNK